MQIVTSLVVFVLVLAVHEAGHAITMMHRGVEIEEAGIGLPVGRLKWTVRPRKLAFPIILSPLIIAAYVKPSDKGQEKIESMRLPDRAICYGAGVITNLVSGLAFLAVYELARGVSLHSHRRILAGVILLVVAAAMARFFRWVALAVPFIGLAILVLSVWEVMSGPSDQANGPIGTIGFVVDVHSWLDVIFVGILLSIGLGPLTRFHSFRSMVAES